MREFIYTYPFLSSAPRASEGYSMFCEVARGTEGVYNPRAMDSLPLSRRMGVMQRVYENALVDAIAQSKATMMLPRSDNTAVVARGFSI